jgi:broad specificity phosphatase PhoE
MSTVEHNGADQQSPNSETESETGAEVQREPSPMDRAFLNNDPDAGELILIRHGQQQWPDQKTATVGDWIDPPLSELGRRQAAAVAEYLADEPITAVYSSNLKRAFDTGRAVAQARGLLQETIEQLAEIQLYGKLPNDSRPVELLGEKVASGARERFIQTKQWDAYPDSETSVDFRRRVGYAVEAALIDHPGETVAVACHGGVINAYLAETLGVSMDMFFRPSHASVHRIRFKGSLRVVDSLNEVTFLRDQDLLSH